MQDWLQVAKALPYGQRTKIECCAADRSCIVEHSAKGYRAWCFRCDPQTPIRFVPHGLRSVKELSEIHATTAKLLSSTECRLPKDYSQDLPVLARKWLLQAGVSDQIRTLYGIGYSPSLQRVVLPVYSDGILQSILMRSLDKHMKPKYIIRSRNPSNAVFVSNPASILPSAKEAGTIDAFDIVITEDVLSSIRVGRHCASGALLGTAVGMERVSQLLHTGRASGHALEWYRNEAFRLRIGLWLDPDKAGRNSANRLLASLTLQGHECVIIKSDKDPKYYSDNQIRDIILARRCSTEGHEEPERVSIAL